MDFAFFGMGQRFPQFIHMSYRISFGRFLHVLSVINEVRLLLTVCLKRRAEAGGKKFAYVSHVGSIKPCFAAPALTGNLEVLTNQPTLAIERSDGPAIPMRYSVPQRDKEIKRGEIDDILYSAAGNEVCELRFIAVGSQAPRRVHRFFCSKLVV